MASEYLCPHDRCRPNTKPSCARCPKMKERYPSSATSAMSDYRRITFMGAVWVKGDYSESDEEHY